MPLVRKPFVLGLYGTSLTQGRLNAEWPQRLLKELQQYPEAKGPIVIFNEGRGSQNSDWGLANIAKVADQRPSHVLMEGFSINDAAETAGVPQVSIANHNTNVTAMVAALRAARANVDIIIQTMNPVSLSGVGIRPNLAAYYTRDVVLSGTLGLTLLDNYAGVAGGPAGGWPKPLPADLTNGAAPFKVPVTGGYLGFDANALWNAADKGANLVIEADGLTISADALGSVRCVQGLVGALTHFEFTPGGLSGVGGYPGVGIAANTAAIANYIGADNNGIGLYNDGTVIRNGVTIGGAGFALTPGVPVAVEYDLAAKRVYFLRGGLKSAGFDTTGMPGTLYPAASANGGAIGTAKFTVDGDGLHPIATGAVDTYLYPNVVAILRAKMAAYWPG